MGTPPGATGGLEFVQATLGFEGFAAEADGAAAEAEGSRQRHVRGGGLAERFERLKAEADDVGGEAEFAPVSVLRDNLDERARQSG